MTLLGLSNETIRFRWPRMFFVTFEKIMQSGHSCAVELIENSSSHQKLQSDVETTRYLELIRFIRRLRSENYNTVEKWILFAGDGRDALSIVPSRFDPSTWLVKTSSF